MSIFSAVVVVACLIVGVLTIHYGRKVLKGYEDDSGGEE